MEYIDVREVNPVYIKGLLAVRLTGYPRGITVAEAKKVIASGKLD